MISLIYAELAYSVNKLRIFPPFCPELSNHSCNRLPWDNAFPKSGKFHEPHLDRQIYEKGVRSTILNIFKLSTVRHGSLYFDNLRGRHSTATLHVFKRKRRWQGSGGKGNICNSNDTHCIKISKQMMLYK